MRKKQGTLPALLFVSMIVAIELGVIFGLMTAIIHKKNSNAVLGAHVSPIRRDDYVFTVIDSERRFWEHTGESVEKVTADWLGYTATYTVNSDGLNNTHEYPLKKAEGVYRIMTLGDSFTFGAWVDTKDNYSSRLEMLLNADGGKNEVLNLGEVAYDVDFMIRRYHLRGEKYKPDSIVMLLCECDITEMAGLMDQRVNTWEHALLRTKTESSALDRELNAIGLAHDEIERMTGNKIETYQLETLRIFLNTVGVPVLILTDENTSLHGRRMLESMTALHANVFFDVLPEFDRLPDKHPSAKGHEQIALAIYADLIRHGLIHKK